MTSRRRVVRGLIVVGRDGSATMETAALVEAVRALVAVEGPAVRVVLQEGGPLVEDFAAIAPTRTVAGLSRRSPVAWVERLLGRLGLQRLSLAIRARRLGLGRLRPSDVVYLHTVCSLQVLRYLAAGTARVLCRVPERAHPLEDLLSAPDLALVIERVDRFLPETHAGAVELCEVHHVDPDRVVRFPVGVVGCGPGTGGGSGAVDLLRRNLGIADDALVVGSFGASATDPPPAFCALAVMLCRSMPEEVVFVHVTPEHTSDVWARHDVEHAGIIDRVIVVGAKEPLPPYVRLCDVAVHAGWGRDHPLAYAEAAAAGIPIVCFAGHELASVVGRNRAGFVCDHLDLAEMADRVVAVVSDSGLRRALGAEAAVRIEATNGIDRVVPTLWKQIQEVSM